MTIASLREGFEKIGLPLWFIMIDLLWIAKPDALGIDARDYQYFANIWLAGGNPWAVPEGGSPYVNGPHTMLLYAPISLLPPTVSIWFWMVLGIGASLWLVRRLKLPLWWLLFPPLTHSIWNGNPQTIVLALLVAGGPSASPFISAATATMATALKLYAGPALIRRPRDLLVVVLVLTITLPLLPWPQFLNLFLSGDIGIHIKSAWNGNAWQFPALVPVVVLALWILRRDGAEWYLVPALLPATQFYYVAMALPAIRQRALVAAALATPVLLMTPLVVIALAVSAMLNRFAPSNDH
jgi:hypothetical protein